MMPSANTVKRDSAPPREHVEQVQDAALLALEQLLQLLRVDAGHGDVRADAVDDERQQQEDQPTPAGRRTCRSWPADSRWLPRRSPFSSRHSGHRCRRRLDGRLGARGGADALELIPCVSSPVLMTLTTLAICGTRPACFSASMSTSAAPRRSRSASVTSALYFSRCRLEAALGQAPLQRHLAAFEADLVIATRTGLLALVAATCGLAQTRADAAADAALGVLGAVGRLDGLSLSVPSQHLHQIGDLVDHAAHRRRVFQLALRC